MTIADIALTLAAELTSLAGSASSTDAATAQAMASRLTSGAAQYNAAVGAIAAAEATFPTVQPAHSDATRAAEVVSGIGAGGALNYQSNGTPSAASTNRFNAARAAILAMSGASAVLAALDAANGQLSRATSSRRNAEKARDSAASSLTTVNAEAQVLIDYLEAI